MNRLLLPRITILLLVVVLVGRLYQLQLVDTEATRFRSVAEERISRELPVRPLRGEVFASDGKTLLAQSLPIYTVALRPANLDKVAPRGTPERSLIFAQLGQVLGITSTLTISPAASFAQNAALRSDVQQGLGAASVAAAQQRTLVQPITLQLGPQQQAAALALTTRYSSTLNLEPPLASASPISSTLTISPASQLQTNPALRNELLRLVDSAVLRMAENRPSSSWVELPVAPQATMRALQLSQAYSQTATLRNPLAERVDASDIPGYQTLPLKRNISRQTAMVLRENAGSLPGIVVEQDYQRRYPLSAAVPSLSHMLGYIGRVTECELVSENPASSWVDAMLDTIGYSAECGIIAKQVGSAYDRYLREDRIGKDGIEASYEDVLRGQLGRESLVIDALGRPISAPQTVEAARNGYNLVLTIDAAFQQQVERILVNWIAEGEKRRLTASGKDAWKQTEYQPIRAGAAVVMEVKTGRVLAMVSWPSYDNNIWDPAQVEQLLRLLNPSDPAQQRELAQLAPLTNRVIGGLYPAGSTLKQFDALIALQNGVITPETQVRDPGRLVVQDQYIAGQTYVYPNAIPRDNKWLTVSDALKLSSNVFFMSVAGGNKDRVINLKDEEKTIDKPLSIGKLAEGLGWFGFGQPTGVKLAGENAGLVPTPAWKLKAKTEAWTTGDTYNTAIGQGNLLVTPLQLATAGAAVANGGTLYQPQLVKAITDANGQVIQQVAPQVVAQVPVNNPSYYATVRDGMRRSVTEGVNLAARDTCSGLQIAGKTGTAEFGRLIMVKGTDGKERPEFQTHSWFVGFAPYDNPEIEVVVLSEGTGSLSDGSATIAVPAVTQIMQAYFGVTPPNPLPRGCQPNMPPLPARQAPTNLPAEILDPRDR